MGHRFLVDEIRFVEIVLLNLASVDQNVGKMMSRKNEVLIQTLKLYSTNGAMIELYPSFYPF